MHRLRTGFLAPLALAAACASSKASAPARPGVAAAPHARGAVMGPSRFFQGLPEEAFWVTHTDALDRVVHGGARLELSPTGELTGAAWDAELTQRGEPLLGAVAVPARQGGGFVHWTRSRVFRSAAFTGPLEPISSPDSTIRGARPGLTSMVVVTDAGPRELVKGSDKLAPLAEPGTADVAALDNTRAVRLDVFGRAASTADGGKTWLDLSPTAGIAVRGISLGERELFVDTWQGRYTLDGDGKLGALEPGGRGFEGFNPSRSFQIAWKNTRASEREGWQFGYREAAPLQAAVGSGAAFVDGTALGVIHNVAMRVELATGKLVSLSTEWIPSGLMCQPLRAEGDVLLACSWERYEGYGGYLFRVPASGPPEVERAFTDEGGFVADDDGAIGFTGACNAVPRLFDPEEAASRMDDGMAPPLKPVFCVRRVDAPGAAPAWVERSVDVSDGSTLVAWVPRKDGTAVALLLSNDPLPERARGAVRVTEQGGVRVYRLRRESAAYSFAPRLSNASWRSQIGSVDGRFSVRPDGAIDGWLSPAEDAYPQIMLGVTITPDGLLEAHDFPPGASAMTVTGSFGVAIAASGELYETTDHGRSWRAAGASPVPPDSFSNSACSALGCALGPVVRIGWGDGKLAPRVDHAGPQDAAPASAASPGEPLPDSAQRPPPLRLVCAPAGSPEPMTPPPAAPASTKQVLSTAYGDTLEVVRDQSVPEPDPANQGLPPGLSLPPGVPLPPGFSLPPGVPLPPGAKMPAPLPSASAAAPAGKPPRSAQPVLRTHTLFFRLPFAPSAALRRLNATDASFSVQRHGLVLPLLPSSRGEAGRAASEGGEVSLLVIGDTSEMLVEGDRITSMPLFEPRRYYPSDGLGAAGLRLPDARALILSEMRRRLSLEEHGGSPPQPPLFLGLERDTGRRRPMTLGLRDDGGVGVLVFDGGAPETVGVADVDRKGAGVLGVRKLAPWSSAVTADDPRCRADRGAYRAVVILDPSVWFEVDAAALPGVSFARLGMALVRWGEERVCIEAIDAAAVDTRRRSDGARSFSLVMRWGGGESGEARREGERVPRGAPAVNAALRTSDLKQGLRCALAPPRPASP